LIWTLAYRKMETNGIGIGMAGNLTIINATPFPWHKTFQHSYQMTEWDFPQQIGAGEIVTVATEWQWMGNRNDDAGEAGYSFTAEDGSTVGFQFHADHKGSPQLSVLLDSASTFGNPPGSRIDLDFTNDGDTPFIFSGNQKASFASSNPPTNWMQQNLASIGCLPLNRICMPASHNAGMSVLNGKTAFASPENTLAHYTDIAGQLDAGFRFFDIRPVVSKGAFFTGHYSQLIDVTWQGGNGQSIAAIIDQINAFLDKNRELIIINLSHTLDTDNDYEPFTQDEQNRLFQQLLRLKYRYIIPDGVKDLSTLTLNDFLAAGPAVIILLDNAQANDHLSASSFPNSGFYTNAQLPIFNSYSNTDQVRQMSADQLSKLAKQRNSSSKEMFLLSWTLTTILDVRLWAAMAHNALFGDLWPVMRGNRYPNFIMVDGIGRRGAIEPGNVAALCVGIAQRFNEDCRG
jgi:hypothetical protein